MVTIEAQAYGPNSLLGIKVVEHVPAGNINQQQQPGGVSTHFAQRAPKQLFTPNRTPGTPQRPIGVSTPPRPHGAPTPPQRPGVAPTPPPYRQGASAPPHRPGIVNTPPIQRPGLSPYQSKYYI